MVETNIPFIFPALCINAVLGLLIVLLGKRLPKDGKWLAVTGSFLVLIAGMMELVDRFQGYFKPTTIVYQWLNEYLQITPVVVGVYSNPSATLLVTVFAFISILWMMSLTSISEEKKPQNVYACLLFSLFGIGLAWYSATPWTSIIGIMLTVLACGLLRETTGGSDDPKRFSPHRFWIDHGIGVFLVFIGILWTWFGFPTMRYDGAVEVLVVETLNVAMIFMFLGMLFVLRILPGVSWVTSTEMGRSEIIRMLKLGVPPVAVISIFYKLTSTFKLDFIYPVLGSSIFVVSIILLVLGAILTTSFQLRRVLIPVFYLMATASFFVGGAIASLTFLIATILIQAKMVIFADAVVNEENRVKTNANREWVDVLMRVLVLFSTMAFPFTLLGAGWVMMFSALFETLPLVYPMGAVFFILNVCVFRLYGFQALHKGRWEGLGGLSALLLIAANTSFVWLSLPFSGFGIGTISSIEDNVASSFLVKITGFDVQSFTLGEGHSVVIVIVGTWLLASGLAYWLNRLNTNDTLSKNGFSKAYRTVVLTEPVLKNLRDSFLVSFSRGEDSIAQQIWKGPLFEWVAKTLSRSGVASREFLEKSFEYLSKGIFLGISKSAAGVQLVQNGSFQRYIVAGAISIICLIALVVMGS